MAYKVVSARSFTRELDAVLSCMVEDLAASKTAARLVSDIEHALSLLADNPRMCAVSKKAQLMNLNLWEYFVESYVIVHQVEGDVVHLVHLFHQSQDFTNLV